MAALPAINRALRERRAFTLVELMVAMSVLALLILCYVTLFNHASQAWITGSGNTERRRNARNLADYISTEIRGAMLPVEQQTANGKGNLQFIVNPSQDQVPAKYRFADAVFWQAPLATESSYGDVAEVGYFVKWDVSNPNAPQPMLCRFFVNPSTTSPTGALEPNPNFLIYDDSPDKWLSEDLIKTVAPATKDSGYAGLFGENVVGLWVRLYGLDGKELLGDDGSHRYDSRRGYTCQFQAMDSSTGKSQTWSETRYLPAKARISIAQIDSHDAPRLAAAMVELQTLTTSPDVHEAADFLAALQTKADSSPALRALLPGIRIYSTEVQLANSR